MEALKIKITGLAPMLMHSARFANPIDPDAIAHKELTSKRKKTEEDHITILKSEWIGSLYYNDSIGVYIPGINIEASLFEAAKMQKLGKQAKRALLVLEDEIKLDYVGPTGIEKLYNNKAFVDVRAVKVGQGKVMRCRPKFDKWACTFTLQFNPEQIQKNEVLKMLKDAGDLVGLGDYRPRFGKFASEVLK